jgi:hypothetical protein
MQMMTARWAKAVIQMDARVSEQVPAASDAVNRPPVVWRKKSIFD